MIMLRCLVLIGSVLLAVPSVMCSDAAVPAGGGGEGADTPEVLTAEDVALEEQAVREALATGLIDLASQEKAAKTLVEVFKIVRGQGIKERAKLTTQRKAYRKDIQFLAQQTKSQIEESLAAQRKQAEAVKAATASALTTLVAKLASQLHDKAEKVGMVVTGYQEKAGEQARSLERVGEVEGLVEGYKSEVSEQARKFEEARQATEDELRRIAREAQEGVEGSVKGAEEALRGIHHEALGELTEAAAKERAALSGAVREQIEAESAAAVHDITQAVAKAAEKKEQAQERELVTGILAAEEFDADELPAELRPVIEADATAREEARRLVAEWADLESPPSAPERMRLLAPALAAVKKAERTVREHRAAQSALAAGREQGRVTGELVAAARRETEHSRLAFDRQAHADKQQAVADRLAAEREDRREQLRAEREMFDRKWGNIQNMFRSAGEGVRNFTSSPRRVGIAVAGVAGVIGSYFLIKRFSGVLARTFEAYLRTPELVRESSNRGMFARMLGRALGKTVTLSDIIVDEALGNDIKSIANALMLARKHKANLPNVGLFGPPGTGKTMLIEALAGMTGMTFAKITGGDVSQLLSSGGENKAVTQLHALFDWLEKNGPSILLIDEAEAFLSARKVNGKVAASEGKIAAINAFLNRTGTASNKVMVVFATNHPEELDWAVQSRVSRWLRMDLPQKTERARMIALYINKLKNRRVAVDKRVTREVIQELATRMDGFSGRDISTKFIDGLHRSVMVTEDKKITPELMAVELDRIERERALLDSWHKEHAQTKG